MFFFSFWNNKWNIKGQSFLVFLDHFVSLLILYRHIFCSFFQFFYFNSIKTKRNENHSIGKIVCSRCTYVWLVLFFQNFLAIDDQQQQQQQKSRKQEKKEADSWLVAKKNYYLPGPKDYSVSYVLKRKEKRCEPFVCRT